MPDPGPDYTVAFDKNGGDTDAEPVTKTVTSSSTNIGSLPKPPMRKGYTFTGWNTQADGSGSAFTATTAVSANITVYAKWTVVPPSEPDIYTVTFNKNGGDTDAEPVTTTVNSPATNIGSPPTPPTRTGYTFAGWNTLADGLG
ncbi:MAG: InlB B-repeat-containing protein, partial [Treponema sp.]|nr:InlB B-repeat-containing protein [Treponema sp.]